MCGQRAGEGSGAAGGGMRQDNPHTAVVLHCQQELMHEVRVTVC